MDGETGPPTRFRATSDSPGPYHRHAQLELLMILRPLVVLSLVGATCASIPVASAQGPCSSGWETTPGSFHFGGTVTTSARLADGRIVIGGSFVGVGTSPARNLAVFDPVSGVWSGLGASPNDRVECLVKLSDDELFVGGTFTTIGGITSNRAAIYNTATGQWISLGSYPGGSANSALRLANGDLIVGGWRGVYQRSAATGAWSSLGQGVRAGFGSPATVNDIDLLPDGRVLVAGLFSTAGSVAAANVAVWDPTTASWSAHGNGLVTGSSTYEVNSVVVLPNGDMLAGGHRTSTGTMTSGLARFDHATGLWSPLPASLAIGFPASTFAWVNSLSVLPDGDVLAGGFFSQVGAVSASGLARLDLDTMTCTPFGSTTDGGHANYTVYGLTSDDRYTLVAGSVSASFGAAPFGVFDRDAGAWLSLNTLSAGPIHATSRLADGRVFVGGSFTRAGGIAASNCAIYDPASGTWQPAGDGVNRAVYAAETLADGSVLVGGEFTFAGSLGVAGLARYSPTTDSWSQLGGVALSTAAVVHAVERLSTGEVLIGGAFGFASGPPAANFGIYSPTTDTLASVPPGLTGTAYAIAEAPNGTAIVGGMLASAGGVAVSRVARFDPVARTWSALGAGIPGAAAVRCVVPMNNGGIVVGLSSTTNVLRVFDPVAGVWSTPPTGVNGAIYAMMPDGAEDVLVGGAFTTANGVAATGLVRYTPQDSLWTPVPGSFASTMNTGGAIIRTLLDDEHGHFVGGSFTSIDGNATVPLARWVDRCAADRDCDFDVDSDDVIAFFGAWDAGDLAGDFNGDGGVDSDDIIGFFAAWDAGC